MSKLTRNQQAALRDYASAGGWGTPGRNQGQIVTVSYGCTPDYAYERSYDASDRKVVVTAYQHSVSGDWSPWNDEPRVGRRVGVIYSGPAYDEPACNEDAE